MRIAIVALTDYRGFPVGGIPMFVRRFAEAVGGLRDTKLVLVGWRPGRRAGTREESVFVSGCEHEFVSVGEGPLHPLIPDRLQFYLRSGRWSAAVQRIGDVDLYYCHSPEAALGVERGGARAPIVLHLHGAVNGIGLSRFSVARVRPVMALYERLFLTPAVRASKVLFATVSDKDFAVLETRLVGAAGVPCLRVPAMVSGQIAKVRSRPSGRELQLVCVGRMERVKGVDFLLRVLKVLRDREIECSLRLVGDGSERNRLMRLTGTLGLWGAVEFVGVQKPKDVESIVAASDLFVSGSHQEGFSLALLEALALGVPAVVTDVGSARDVVRNGITGFIVQARDENLFAERILEARALRDEMRVSCEAVATLYSSTRISGLIMNVFARLVAGEPLGQSRVLPQGDLGLVSGVR